MKDILLSIDIGSTSIKSIAFDLTGLEITSEKRVMKYETDESNHIYIDPDYVWESVIDTLKDINAKAKDVRICAIAVTGMGNDGVPIDHEGKWVYPIIAWKCKRKVPQLEKVASEIGLKAYYMITGLQARTVDTIFNIMWLKENHPEAYHKTYKWLMIEDYINYKLCGSMVTDYSIASTTGLFDITKMKWSKEMMSTFDLQADILPDVEQSGKIIGTVLKEVADITGIDAGVPIVLGGWDIQCAALVLGYKEKDYVIDTMGTWETVNIVSDTLLLNKDTYDLGFNTCCHVTRGQYTHPVFLLSSSIVEWYLDNNYKTNAQLGVITTDKIYEDFIADISASNPGANGLMFLPHIAGCFFPGSDPRSLGAYVGISAKNTKSDFTRAIIEGLCYMSKEVVSRYEILLNNKLRNITVSGGGIRNNAWMQIKSDIYGENINVSNIVETTALGASILAGIGVGVYKDEKEAYKKLKMRNQLITPKKDNISKYQKYYEIYRHIYPSLKKISHQLYTLGE